MKGRMHVTGEMIVAITLALLGSIGTMSGLLLNWRVRAEVAKINTRIEIVRTESVTAHSSVLISLEQLKTRLAEQDAATYRQIMKELKDGYWDRNLVEAKHVQNTQRLDLIEKRLMNIEERLPV